jgi:hypothetical protein
MVAVFFASQLSTIVASFIFCICACFTFNVVSAFSDRVQLRAIRLPINKQQQHQHQLYAAKLSDGIVYILTNTRDNLVVATARDSNVQLETRHSTHSQL